MPSAPPAETFLSTSAVHNHPPPQHVVSSRAARRPSGALYAHLRWQSMQDPANELRRILLPHTPVNKEPRKLGTAPSVPTWVSPRLQGSAAFWGPLRPLVLRPYRVLGSSLTR